MCFLKVNIDKHIKNDNVPALLKFSGHRKPHIRLKAFTALSKKMHDPEIQKKIKIFVEDPDPIVRTTAVMKFAEFGDPDVFKNLKPIFSFTTRREKIEILRILALHQEIRHESISSILALALKDKNHLVQLESIRTMGALKDRLSIRHLNECLNDARFNVRLEAVKALGQIGTEEVVDYLIGSLLDKNADVRRTARESLEAIGTPKATYAIDNAPFTLLVKRMNENNASRLEAIRHIAKHKINEALPLLVKACADEYKSVRLEAVMALGQVVDFTAFETIVKLLDDPYYDVRLETVKSLERYRDPRTITFLERAMEDYNKNVREEAKKVYYNMKARLKI